VRACDARSTEQELKAEVRVQEAKIERATTDLEAKMQECAVLKGEVEAKEAARQAAAAAAAVLLCLFMYHRIFSLSLALPLSLSPSLSLSLPRCQIPSATSTASMRSTHLGRERERATYKYHSSSLPLHPGARGRVQRLPRACGAGAAGEASRNVRG